MAIMAGLWMSFCDNCKYVNITEATYLRLSQGSCFVCLPTFTSTQISFSLLFSIYFIHAEGITELWFRSCCHGNIFFLWLCFNSMYYKNISVLFRNPQEAVRFFVVLFFFHSIISRRELKHILCFDKNSLFLTYLKEKASQLNNCYNSIHCNFLFVNN